MTTPISNDKILPSDSSNGAVGGKRKTEQETTSRQNTGNEAISPNESSVEASSVDIDRANQVYNQSAPRVSSSEDSISNSEQATAVAAKIRTLMEENGVQAFKAQAGSNPGSLAALLEAAPA